ncbi:P-loop containing nucleoside triphosphate hydrolase protein, partial [Penicillium sp. IBT 35674x]
MFGLKFTGKSGTRPKADSSGNEKKTSRFSLGFGTSSKSSISGGKGGAPSKESIFDFRDGFQPRSTDVFIAVMGVTGAGKSTFISLLTQKAVRIGHELQACTQEVEVYQCKYSDEVNVYLVDTPGFDDTNRSDTEVLREIATWLTNSFTNKVMLNGIIYLHRITDRRMQGSAKKNFRMFKQLCGDEAAKNVILATTMWEEVVPTDGQKREAELIVTPEFWGYMISKGSQAHRHMNTKESAMQLIDVFATAKLENRRVALRIQNEMVQEQKDLNETAAGKEVQSEILKERKKWRKEFEETKREMEEALAAKDEESIQLLREEQLKLKAYMTKSEKNQKALKIGMEKMHAEKYAKLEKALRTQQADAQKKLEKQQKESEKAFERHRKQHAKELETYQHETLQQKQAMERKLEEQQVENVRTQREQHGGLMERLNNMQEAHAKQLDGQRHMYEDEMQKQSHRMFEQQRKQHAEELAIYQLQALQYQKAMGMKLEEQRTDSARAQHKQHQAFMQTVNTLTETHAQQLDKQRELYEFQMQNENQNARSETPSTTPPSPTSTSPPSPTLYGTPPIMARRFSREDLDLDLSR